MTRDELNFVVFCIENYADAKGLDAKKVYNTFRNESDIINNYIIKHYDVLHTQGKNYIVDDLDKYLNLRGIKVC